MRRFQLSSLNSGGWGLLGIKEKREINLNAISILATICCIYLFSYIYGVATICQVLWIQSGPWQIHTLPFRKLRARARNRVVAWRMSQGSKRHLATLGGET